MCGTFAQQARLRLFAVQKEALLVGERARLLAVPTYAQGDLGEVEDAELRTAAVRLVGELLDALVAFIRVEPEVVVDLLELRLEVQVEEEAADVDQRADARA